MIFTRLIHTVFHIGILLTYLATPVSAAIYSVGFFTQPLATQLGGTHACSLGQSSMYRSMSYDVPFTTTDGPGVNSLSQVTGYEEFSFMK